MARPGATYSAVEAIDAAACERLCADDTICMAWSFRENSCELKATVPAAIVQTGVISGVSTRAPASLRVRYEQQPTASEAATAPETQIEADATSSPILEEDEVSLALLGGPEPEEDLRNRLGN